MRLTHGVLSPSVGKELDNCKCSKKLRNENLVVIFFDVRLFNKYLSLLTWCKKVNLCKIKISIKWFSSCLHRLSQYQLSNSIHTLQISTLGSLNIETFNSSYDQVKHVSNRLQRCQRVWDHMRSVYYIYIIPLSSNDDISKRRTYPKTIGPTSTCITILKSKIICCYQLFWIWTFLTPAPIMAYEKSASLSSHVGPKESTFGTDLKRMGSRKLWKSTFVTKRMSS